MENNLPKGWTKATLNEIAEWGSGGTPRSTEPKYYNGEIPWLIIGDLNDGYVSKSAKSITKLGLENSSAKYVPIGSVMIAMYGSIGKLGIANFNCTTNQAIAFTKRIHQGINNKYLYYYLYSLRKYLLELGKGGTQANISLTVLKKVPFLFPPVIEQKRIVEKLDKLFSRLETIKSRLDKIPLILKRFRQSVLDFALNGEGVDVMTKDVCELIQIGPFGTQLHKRDYILNGIPIINPTHIQKGRIISDFDFTIGRGKFNELRNYHLKEGDVIMGRRGEMARCALVGKLEDGWLCGTGSLFFRPLKGRIIPQYLFLSLNNDRTKEFLEAESKGTTMSNLNLNIANRIPLFCPSLKKQHEIIRRVESLFKTADQIEERYKKAKAHIEKLTQSILAKAFRGELVPQNVPGKPD
jgi:type I restriction enzyme S subunit